MSIGSLSLSLSLSPPPKLMFIERLSIISSEKKEKITSKTRIKKIKGSKRFTSRSQWPHGLRRKSAAARLLRSWVRIPPGGGHGCLSVVSVVCCQVEVSATS